jgi:hypothetical protein
LKSGQKKVDYNIVFDISSLTENVKNLQMQLYASMPVENIRTIFANIFQGSEGIKVKYTKEELLRGYIVISIKGYVYDLKDNVKTDNTGNPIIKKWQYYEMENRIQIIHGTKMVVINLGDKRPNLNALMRFGSILRV